MSMKSAGQSLGFSGEIIDPNLLWLVVEQSPSSILITNQEKKIIYVNRKYIEIMGFDRGEVLGRIPQVFRKSNGGINYQTLWDIVSSGEEWRGDCNTRRKNGEYFWERVAVSPIMDSAGNITHFLIIKEDITEQKKTAEVLEKTVAESTQMAMNLELLNAELKDTQSQMLQREKMASIGQLAAGVAHEINNPIGFVSSNLRSLEKYLDKFLNYLNTLESGVKSRSPDLWEEMKPQREKMKIGFLIEDSNDLLAESLEGSERVRKIVQNLKTFSRVDQAGMQLVDLNECLESTINIVWNEIKYKAVLKKDFAVLPQLECNSQELTQVFTNILVNAAQAIEKDGLISISSCYEPEEIVISISDNGSGIPKDIQGKIFEPFFTTKPVGKGTGLGMSISYEIIKRHGGEITFHSCPEQGTTFNIRLPLNPENQLT